jgi:hypothetical protein
MMLQAFGFISRRVSEFVGTTLLLLFARLLIVWGKAECGFTRTFWGCVVGRLLS